MKKVLLQSVLTYSADRDWGRNHVLVRKSDPFPAVFMRNVEILMDDLESHELF